MTMQRRISAKLCAMQVILVVALVVPVASLPQRFYLPIDCEDVYQHDNSSPSGVYTIFPGGPTTPLHAYCDMDTDGGKWTVIQRRIDGSQNFHRPWKPYKTGFGDVAGEYWLGLDNILLLTMRKRNELRVDMEDWDAGKVYAQYSSFSIDPESYGYKLHLGSYIDGGAGDSLVHHNNMMFTTYDNDQDPYGENCAYYYFGGFWYHSGCFHANPNGLYTPHGWVAYGSVGINWSAWKGSNYSLKNISMKIRPLVDSGTTQESQE